MTFCINPRCATRQNPPDEEDFCQACGTPLKIQGRYWLVERLHKQNKGYSTREIYKAEDSNFERDDPQRWKVIKVVSDANPTSVSQLEKEAKVLLQLQKYGGIPQIEVGAYFPVQLSTSSETLHCLVMEFIKGEDLEKYLSGRFNSPMPADLAWEGLRQIAETLERLHSLDHVHRDIKPLNIMLRDRQFVLIDFGSVGKVGRGSTGIGTPGYVAPEQFQDGLAIQQSDFFSLGLTFAHLLTGKHPNELEYSQTGQLNWPDSALPVSQELKQLIDDLMAPSPQQRPENARKILLRLGSQSSSLGQGSGKRSQRDRNRIIQWFYKAFFLLLIPLISTSEPVRRIAHGWIPPSQPNSQPITGSSNSNSTFHSVKFTGKVGMKVGVNLCLERKLNSCTSEQEPYNKTLNFDGWDYGETVNDIWTGDPDALWYKLSGQNRWVPSARINGYPPDKPPLQPTYSK